MKNHIRLASIAAGLIAAALPAFGQVTGQTFKLLPSDGDDGDFFGYSIDFEAGTVVVGARYDEHTAPEAGSAYVFNSATGAQTFKLLASDGALGDRFGDAVAISGGVIAVGAGHADNANGTDAGSTYLFDASTGLQTGKLIASDGNLSDYFGEAIAMDGSIVAVGSSWHDLPHTGSGTVYLFDAVSGLQLNKLTAADSAPGDQFGKSVAMSGGLLVVGSYNDDDKGDGSGSAYLFNASTGAQLFKMTASDGVAQDQLGWSVAIDGNVVAVGTKQHDGGKGAVYLFDATTGTQTAKLMASDAFWNDNFGWSVAIDNGTVVIGAFGADDNGFDSGCVYQFDAATGVELGKLLPTDGSNSDTFGNAICFDAGVVCAAARGDGDNGFFSGSAYVFDLNGGTAGTIATYGMGLGGANIGSLTSASTPNIGTTIQLDVSGFPNSSALLMTISGAQTSLPIFGGTLLVGLPQQILSMPFAVTGGSGAVNVSIPAISALVGLNVYAQCGGVDPTQVAGIALSNGLQITIGQ